MCNGFKNNDYKGPLSQWVYVLATVGVIVMGAAVLLAFNQPTV